MIAWWLLGALALGTTAYVVSSSVVKAANASKTITRLVPLPNEPPYDASDLSSPYILKASPSGARWLLLNYLSLSSSTAVVKLGYDTDGQYWATTMFSLTKVDLTDGPAFAEAISRAVVKYVVPALAGLVAAVVPGVGGIAAAAAITAWQKLASGASLNDVIIATAKEKLPSLLAGDTFDKALALARTAKNYSDVIREKLSLKTEAQKTAFDQALIFAEAEKAQRRAIGAIKNALSYLPNYADISMRIDEALKHGAAIADIAYVYGGEDGVVLMQQAFDSADAETGIAASDLVDVAGKNTEFLNTEVASGIVDTAAPIILFQPFKRS